MMIPHMDVEVDSCNVRTDACTKLLSVIKPEWRLEDIEFKDGSGYVNITVICYTDANPKDAVVVRVTGTTCSFPRDMARERDALEIFHEMGLSPKVYCTFNNGFCMEYVEGITFTWDDLTQTGLRDKKIIKAVARELAKIHGKKARTLAIDKYRFKEVPALESVTEAWLENFPSRMSDPEADELFQSAFPSVEILKAERKRMLKVLADSGSPLVFAHLDANPTNIIYLKDQDRAFFIDYDTSSINYATVDLATFLEFAAIGLGGADVDDDKRFSKEFQMEFLKEYLQTKCSLDDPHSEVTEKDVETLYVQTSKAALANIYLFYPIAFVTIANGQRIPGTDPVDFIRLSLSLFTWYSEHRDEILAMKPPLE